MIQQKTLWVCEASDRGVVGVVILGGGTRMTMDTAEWVSIGVRPIGTDVSSS